jgi:steroid delta-isomerase-like uncharacterized protein
MEPSPETVEFLTPYSAAWAAHDPDAIIAMHTDDTVFDMHNGAGPADGRAAARNAMAALFAQSPDLSFAPKTLRLGDDHVVTEYVVSGTVDGTGFACDGVDVFTLRDGLIARKDTYLDYVTYARQLGVDLAAAPA